MFADPDISQRRQPPETTGGRVPKLPGNFAEWPEGMRRRYLRHALFQASSPPRQSFARCSS